MQFYIQKTRECRGYGCSGAGRSVCKGVQRERLLGAGQGSCGGMKRGNAVSSECIERFCRSKKQFSLRGHKVRTFSICGLYGVGLGIIRAGVWSGFFIGEKLHFLKVGFFKFHIFNVD